jgi:hypothetical protein
MVHSPGPWCAAARPQLCALAASRMGPIPPFAGFSDPPGASCLLPRLLHHGAALTAAACLLKPTLAVSISHSPATLTTPPGYDSTARWPGSYGLIGTAAALRPKAIMVMCHVVTQWSVTMRPDATAAQPTMPLTVYAMDTARRLRRHRHYHCPLRRMQTALSGSSGFLAPHCSSLSVVSCSPMVRAANNQPRVISPMHCALHMVCASAPARAPFDFASWCRVLSIAHRLCVLCLSQSRRSSGFMRKKPPLVVALRALLVLWTDLQILASILCTFYGMGPALVVAVADGALLVMGQRENPKAGSALCAPRRARVIEVGWRA